MTQSAHRNASSAADVEQGKYQTRSHFLQHGKPAEVHVVQRVEEAAEQHRKPQRRVEGIQYAADHKLTKDQFLRCGRSDDRKELYRAEGSLVDRGRPKTGQRTISLQNGKGGFNVFHTHVGNAQSRSKDKEYRARQRRSLSRRTGQHAEGRQRTVNDHRGQIFGKKPVPFGKDKRLQKKDIGRRKNDHA